MSNVLITGTSSGFGQLTALALARRGDRVFATMRNPNKAQTLTDAARAEELALSIHQLDVTDPASVTRAVAEITELTGTIDVLINNAGVGLRGPVETLADDELHAQLDTNVVGALRTIRTVVPLMRKQGTGTIVNVSSMAGLIGVPFEGAYAASKHALEALSEALRFELAPDNIRVFIIEPGAFATAFTDNAHEARAFSPQHPQRAAYDRFWQAIDTGLHADGRADPDQVVHAITQAIDQPDGPFRRLVGQDAELICALKHDHPFEAFEHTVRATLGLDQPVEATSTA